MIEALTEALKVLEELGSKTIKEQTRISEVAIGAIINKDFENLHRVQLHGFISILEEQYDINLDGLLDEYDAFQLEHGKKEQKLFMHIPQDKKPIKGLRLIVVISLILAVVIATYFILERKSEVSVATVEQSTQTPQVIEEAKEHLDLDLVAVTKMNQTDEVAEEIEPKLEELEMATKSLSIIPRVQIWAGMINLKDHSKVQRTAEEEFDLNVSKNWLIVLGHGRVDIHTNKEVLNFDTAEMLRFSYIDAEIKKITRDEFKELNLGRDW